MSRIVVGVDGSETADAALAWAAGEARLRRAHLDIVHAYTYPVMGDFPVAELDSALVDEAQAVLDGAVARADLDNVEFDARLEREPVAMGLVEAAEGADLLVVGSRGRGGFVGLLLGSVSQQCAHHAQCHVLHPFAHHTEENQVQWHILYGTVREGSSCC